MPERPHILIIMPDQQRGDCLSCAGHPVLRTPNMDRIAAEGIRFPRATTTSPVCMPARSSFISGMFPHQTGIWTNSGSLPAEDPTFFQALRRVGYRTAHIGKSHYYAHRPGHHLREHEPYMHARGFDYVHEVTGPHATLRCNSAMTDRWERLGLLKAFRDDYERRIVEGGPSVVRQSPLPWEEYLDSYVGRETVEYIEGLDGDEPTCTYVGFPGPHEPWDAPGEYATMYRAGDMPPAVMPEDGERWVSEALKKKMLHGRYPASMLTTEKIGEIRASYYGKITLIDYWVGQILDAYERRGWLDDALVIFFSDHGEMAGDHHRLFKEVFYHGSVDVPLLVRWPGRAPAGAVSDAFVQQTDIYPTILDVVGEKLPGRLAGKSLVPLFADPNHPFRDTAYSEVATGLCGKAIMAQTARWKYVMDESGEGVYLFDEEQDRGEQRNLVGHTGFRHVEADMRDRILRFLVRQQTVL